jgi:HPt (histidine-containing phosphotransfer) domain-containing protein
MDGYITKPIRTEAFLATVESLGLGGQASGPSEDPGARPGIREVVFDVEDALTRTRGKRDLLRKVADLFLADAPALLARIRAATAAGDRPTLERDAHRLKGAAANLSAGRVAGAAGRLEEIARRGDLAAAEAACAELGAEVDRLEEALAALTEAGVACEC